MDQKTRVRPRKCRCPSISRRLHDLHTKSYLRSGGLSWNCWIWSSFLWRKSCIYSFWYISYLPILPFTKNLLTASELAQQIKATEPRLIFVHPSLCKTALEAASRVGFCIDRLFLFSDDEAPSIGGLQDWRELIGTERQGESWRWQSLTARESATTVATVNFSSGYSPKPNHQQLINDS